MSGNPISGNVDAWTFKGLENLDEFVFDGPLSSNCTNGTAKTAHNLTFCVSEMHRDDDEDGSHSHSHSAVDASPVGTFRATRFLPTAMALTRFVRLSFSSCASGE